MIHRNQRHPESEEAEWTEWFCRISLKLQEPENIPAIVEYLWSSIDGRHGLNPVKFTKTHEVIIMAMGPYHRINMGRSIDQQLLPQIG
jgi:hypothetical protein